MQIKFNRWSLNQADRNELSVDPTRVDATEHFGDAFTHQGTGEEFPAATIITMKNKQRFYVQGSVSEVVEKLNRIDEAYLRFEKVDPPLDDVAWENLASIIANNLGLKWNWHPMGGIEFTK